MYKYLRDDVCDEYGFAKLQDKILEISNDVHQVCMQKKIDYFLMGGTALGAVRHGGFIPWDDDFDIYMTYENYLKLKKILLENYDEKYFIQEIGESKGLFQISKIRLNGTTYIEPLYINSNIHQGIFIDIFIIHKLPKKNRFYLFRNYFWAKYLDLISLSHRGYTRRKGFYRLLLYIFKLLPYNFLRNHALKSIFKYDNNNDFDIFCNFTGKAKFKQGYYSKDIFIEPRKMAFEKLCFLVPNKIEEFLAMRFGDYSKIPSKEKIKWEQHALYWDINKDYKAFLKELKNEKTDYNS